MTTSKINDNTSPDNEVIVYSQPGCGKCAVVKHKLLQKGVSYKQHDSVTEMLEIGLKSTPAVKTTDGELLTDFMEIVNWVDSL